MPAEEKMGKGKRWGRMNSQKELENSSNHPR
jgi:hypothetical protein